MLAQWYLPVVVLWAYKPGGERRLLLYQRLWAAPIFRDLIFLTGMQVIVFKKLTASL